MLSSVFNQAAVGEGVQAMTCFSCSATVPILAQALLAISVVLMAILIALVVNKFIEFAGFNGKLKIRVVVRWAMALLLTITFFINVYSSAMQVQEGKTLFEKRRIYIENLTYPSVTLCPTSKDQGTYYHVCGKVAC